jgi:hypothetical protein
VTLGQRSQAALDDFLANANTGARHHPLDTRRWNVFIIAVRIDGGTVDYLALSERLSETGFDEDIANGLLSSLTDGLELLKMWDDRDVDTPK